LAAFPTTITADEQQLAAVGALIAEPAEQEAAAAGQQGAAEQAPQQAGQQQGEGHVPGPVKESSSGDNGSCAQQQERLRVVLEWRLAQKSILHKGVALCDAVLAALEAAAPTAPDTGRQIAAMHRATPRW
jgi:pyruvate/2-oxoglutarate dehydrogenase complex dihydrolipoamide acyltransferase (E2) component